MKLRGSVPSGKPPRLKLLMFSAAGIGKTTASIKMKNCYVIDAEGGTETYQDIIQASGGAVFETTNFNEVIEEVRTLSSIQHDYLTLVIDPFTPLYDELVDEGERRVGSDYGRNYGYANKKAKRLYRLLSQLDMNVIVTCHEKNLYGDNLQVIGQTFDGWKKLDYLFHLVLQLERKGKKRLATVRKSRLREFPDQGSFEWNYENLINRFGADRLEKSAAPIQFAGKETLELFTQLYRSLSPADVSTLGINKVIASEEEIIDLSEERLLNGIKMMEGHKAKILPFQKTPHFNGMN